MAYRSVRRPRLLFPAARTHREPDEPFGVGTVQFVTHARRLGNADRSALAQPVDSVLSHPVETRDAGSVRVNHEMSQPLELPFRGRVIWVVIESNETLQRLDDGCLYAEKFL